MSAARSTMPRSHPADDPVKIAAFRMAMSVDREVARTIAYEIIEARMAWNAAHKKETDHV